MGEGILWSALALSTVCYLAACWRGPHPLRRLLFHSLLGFAALTLLHVGGHAFGVSFLPHWNLINGVTAGVLGLPGVTVLTVMGFLLFA